MTFQVEEKHFLFLLPSLMWHSYKRVLFQLGCCLWAFSRHFSSLFQKPELKLALTPPLANPGWSRFCRHVGPCRSTSVPVPYPWILGPVYANATIVAALGNGYSLSLGFTPASAPPKAPIPHWGPPCSPLSRSARRVSSFQPPESSSAFCFSLMSSARLSHALFLQCRLKPESRNKS